MAVLARAGSGAATATMGERMVVRPMPAVERGAELRPLLAIVCIALVIAGIALALATAADAPPDRMAPQAAPSEQSSPPSGGAAPPLVAAASALVPVGGLARRSAAGVPPCYGTPGRGAGYGAGLPVARGSLADPGFGAAPFPAAEPVVPEAATAAPPLGRPPFQEAHWQGIEVIPLTSGLARLMRLPASIEGVVADDVTLPADMLGFQAGDVVISVDGVPTPTLEAFIRATDRVRGSREASLRLFRKGREVDATLIALDARLGVANGETAPMIKAGSRPPHGYQGPCTACHRIGSTGQLPVDQGDLLSRTAPPIAANAVAPHRDRGPCTACHRIGSAGQPEVDPGVTLSRTAPPIAASAVAPHGDRGTCTACHQVLP